MQSELKPCAHCGGEAELRGFQAPEFWVACPKVGCKAHTEGFGSKERAIAAWNTRASDAEIIRLTEAMRAAEEQVKGLREALEPFAKCCEDWISDAADDEAWVRFRLLIKDYRRARQALVGAKP